MCFVTLNPTSYDRSMSGTLRPMIEKCKSVIRTVCNIPLSSYSWSTVEAKDAVRQMSCEFLAAAHDSRSATFIKQKTRREKLNYSITAATTVDRKVDSLLQV
jgi:hypothetical protein